MLGVCVEVPTTTEIWYWLHRALRLCASDSANVVLEWAFCVLNVRAQRLRSAAIWHCFSINKQILTNLAVKRLVIRVRQSQSQTENKCECANRLTVLHRHS